LSALAPIAPRRAATALSARAIGEERMTDIAAMIADADRLVAVCAWLRDLMTDNGARPDQVVLSRQGVPKAGPVPKPPVRAASGSRRLLYLGRWDRSKGIDILVAALRAEPALELELVIHGGLAAGADDQVYQSEVAAIAEGDRRIRIEGPLQRDTVASAMRDFDALAVPSTCLETGPMVALEAQAAGLYVIGSDLGGLSELIDAPWKGTLVRAGDIGAWRRALALFAAEGPPPRPPGQTVRRMADAAADMARLYASLD
jgi:glycosyltransferase involved in cell wall biosynthesis